MTDYGIEYTRCKKCGAKYDAAAKRCPSCGKKNPDPKVKSIGGSDGTSIDERTLLKQMFEEQKKVGVENLYENTTGTGPMCRCKKCDTKYDATLVKCPYCGKKNPNPVTVTAAPKSELDSMIEELMSGNVKEEPIDEIKTRSVELVDIDESKLGKKDIKLAKLIKEEREIAKQNEAKMMAKINELTNRISSNAVISKNKDLYVSRLYNENYSLKNTCDRLREENRRQSDKKVQEFLTSIAEIMTKTDSGIIENDDKISTEKQFEYVISKLKNILVTQDYEITYPKIGSTHNRMNANCKQTIYTTDSNLIGKIASIERVGIRNKKDGTMLVNSEVHVYDKEE